MRVRAGTVHCITCCGAGNRRKYDQNVQPMGYLLRQDRRTESQLEFIVGALARGEVPELEFDVYRCELLSDSFLYTPPKRRPKTEPSLLAVSTGADRGWRVPCTRRERNVCASLSWKVWSYVRCVCSTTSKCVWRQTRSASRFQPANSVRG